MSLRLSESERARLCCPDCAHARNGPEHALEPRTGGLECPGCRRLYPVVEGIPDLRPERIEESAVGFYDRGYVEETYGRDEQDEHVAPLREWLSRVPAEGFVLELGTGRGALQDVHPGYVGTDLSLEVLRRRIRRPAFASNAERLPLRTGSVDALFSVAVLEHIPSPRLALAEIARVLAPGGIAYLAPAWNCRPWAADGIHVRPWIELDWRQRAEKLTIPLRNSLVWRGSFAIPKRALRELTYRIHPRPTTFRYRPLEANYEVFWASDSDATASLDPHEAGLYFRSRAFEILHPPGGWRSLFHRAQPLVVVKAGR